SAAVAGRALKAELVVIQPMKPHLYGTGRHSDVTFAVNDAILGFDAIAGGLQCRQRGTKLFVEWAAPAAAFALACAVGQVLSVADIALRIRHHAPRRKRNLFRPQAGPDGQQDHDVIALGIPPLCHRAQGRLDLSFGENLRLLPKPRHRIDSEYEFLLKHYKSY